MYEAFFGLSSKPFQLNPDPKFYYSSKPHRRARSYLVYGVMRGEGFIVITGEVGAGKTTIVRDLLDSLPEQQQHQLTEAMKRIQALLQGTIA